MTDIEYPMNDAGLGQRLADMFSNELKWVTDRRQFVVWDGMRFGPQPDETLAERFAKRAAFAITENELPLMVDTDRRQALTRYAARALDMTKIRSAVASAKSVEKMRVHSRELDKDPHLLTTRNGTVDLRTGNLRPHNPDDLITRLVPVNYNPNAPAFLWESLLLRATRIDQTGQTADTLRMALGYSLFGGNPENRMFFIIGPGGTGKSKVCEIPRKVLGDDYAWASKPSLITRGSNDVHAEEMAVLEHKRYITISETDGSMSLDEARFKAITGADHLPVRSLYGPQRLATVEATFVVCTNEAPKIEKFDDAIQRRLTIIPSGPPLSESEKDPELAKTILREEAEGVLASLVRGAVEWYALSRQGREDHDRRTNVVFDSHVSAAVALETHAFAQDNDPIIEFIDEWIEYGEGMSVLAASIDGAYSMARMSKDRVGKRKLYERLQQVSRDRGENVWKDGRNFYGMRLRSKAGERLWFEG